MHWVRGIHNRHCQSNAVGESGQELFVNVDFRQRELLCDTGLTFFVNLLASEISFVSLDKSPNKNSDDDWTVVALHKAA